MRVDIPLFILNGVYYQDLMAEFHYCTYHMYSARIYGRKSLVHYKKFRIVGDFYKHCAFGPAESDLDLEISFYYRHFGKLSLEDWLLNIEKHLE